MIIIKGIFSGIIATLIFDLYQYSLSYAYNIDKPRWDLVGRYFAGLKNKKYFSEKIDEEIPIKYELLIGYVTHYFIGIIYGVMYVLFNYIFFEDPSFFLALSFGFATVIGGWCVMMPFVYNIGFFASKKEERMQIIVQNLLAHFIFGVGLYAGY
ncbi:uncharacterized protein METZ01_LOCUS516950, partial [marine metagenome]